MEAAVLVEVGLRGWWAEVNAGRTCDVSTKSMCASRWLELAYAKEMVESVHSRAHTCGHGYEDAFTPAATSANWQSPTHARGHGYEDAFTPGAASADWQSSAHAPRLPPASSTSHRQHAYMRTCVDVGEQVLVERVDQHVRKQRVHAHSQQVGRLRRR